MTHFFLDTDILLDFLGKREPFAKHAAGIFIGAFRKKYSLYTSSNSITTAYYILCKDLAEKKARSLVEELVEHINIIPVTDRILVSAFRSSFADFEDAVQHFAALTNERIEFIVTRNIRDYRHSQVKVIGPEQAKLI